MRGKRILFKALGAALLGGALWASGASAATIVVDTTTDDYDVNPTCSLREAVEAANDNGTGPDLGCNGDSAGADTIVLQSGQTYTLDNHNPPEDANIYGDLDISGGGGTTIQSNGPGLATIDGYGLNAPLASKDRVIDVLPAAGPVTLLRLRIQNGFERSGTGGGGIHSEAALSVIDSEVVDNNVSDDGVNGAPLIRGGGVFNDGGFLTITRSTVAENTTNDGIDGEGQGGGVANLGGPLIATNSTISGNVAKEEPAGFFSDPVGGGIFQFTAVGTSMTLTNVTITNNSVTSSEGEAEAGGLYIAGVGPADTITGTIIAGNSAPGAHIDDCFGTVYSSNNLIGPPLGCTRIGGANDLVDASPNLGILSNYGGPTRTHILNPGSPAIDHGGSCPATDQRGLFRAPVAPCDTGAFELGATASLPAQTPPPTTSPGPTGQRAAALKKCKKKRSKKARKKCKKKALKLPL